MNNAEIIEKFRLYFETEYKETILRLIDEVEVKDYNVKYEDYSIMLQEVFDQIVIEYVNVNNEDLKGFERQTIGLTMFLKMNSIDLKKNYDSMIFNKINNNRDIKSMNISSEN